MDKIENTKHFDDLPKHVVANLKLFLSVLTLKNIYPSEISAQSCEYLVESCSSDDSEEYSVDDGWYFTIFFRWVLGTQGHKVSCALNNYGVFSLCGPTIEIFQLKCEDKEMIDTICDKIHNVVCSCE